MRATASATVLMIPAMVQMLLLHEGSDEDKERFNELSDAERLKAYHMATKNGFVRYPKPQGLYAGVITAIEGVFMSDPRTWGQVSRDVLTEAIPQSLIPTALQLGWELSSGERIGATAGYATIPTKLKGVEDAESRDAPAVAEAISALGLRVKSPMAIENLISGYTGGLGWVLMDAPQAVQDMIGADPQAAYTPANYPITRLMAYKDPTWGKRTISTFYDMMADLSAQSMTVKDKEKQVAEHRMTVEEMMTYLKQHPKALFGAEASDALKSVAHDFAEARTYYERINRDTALSEVERRQKMDDLMDKITDAARLATEQVKAAAVKNGVKLAWNRR
jgi:hypothetical protein